MTTEQSQPAYLIAAAIVRRGEQVLLIREQSASDEPPVWALPAGRNEPGELLPDALIHALREDTGLEIADIQRLAYVTQLDEHENGFLALAFVFEVERWEGELHAPDPDNEIPEARFMPVGEAIQALNALPYRFVREPCIAYLEGRTPPGAMWFYRREAGAPERLVARLTDVKHPQ